MQSKLNTNADIVIHPQVGAACVNLGVPGAELIKSDTRCRIDRITVITRLDLVELLAVAHNARHLRLRGGGRRRRVRHRGGGRGVRNVHADVVVQPEVGASCSEVRSVANPTLVL